MTIAMYERLAKVQNDWTVILQTEDDGIQVYLESAKQELGFAEFYFLSYDGNYITPGGETGYLGLQDGDLLGVMPRPVYILHLEDAFLQDDIEA